MVGSSSSKAWEGARVLTMVVFGCVPIGVWWMRATVIGSIDALVALQLITGAVVSICSLFWAALVGDRHVAQRVESKQTEAGLGSVSLRGQTAARPGDRKRRRVQTFAMGIAVDVTLEKH